MSLSDHYFNLMTYFNLSLIFLLSSICWKNVKKYSNEEPHANSLSKLKLKFTLQKSVLINLNVRLFYTISEEKYILRIYKISHHSTAAVFLLHSSILSEGTGANHSHHHYVANGCQYSDPQPNGVTGHFPIILCFGGSRVAGVEVGGWRLQGRVAIVRRIHEGPAHSREMLSGERERKFILK